MKAIIALLITSAFAFCQEPEKTYSHEEAVQISMSATRAAFPEADIKNSALCKRMYELNDIAKSRSSELYEDANKILTIAVIASGELGVTPKLSALTPEQIGFYEGATEYANKCKELLASGKKVVSREEIENTVEQVRKGTLGKEKSSISRSERSKMEYAVCNAGLTSSLYVARRMPDDDLSALYPQALQIIELRNIRNSIPQR